MTPKPTSGLFAPLSNPRFEGLEAAVQAFGPGALQAVNWHGESLHAVAHSKFMACVIAEGPEIQELGDCLRWLMDRSATYTDPHNLNGVALRFCNSNWAGTKHADIACELMADYVERHLLEPDALVRCTQSAHPKLDGDMDVPALVATFMCANPAAARILLDGGADEALALNGSGHTDLAEYAASFGHWSSGMVAATVREFQMQRRIDMNRLVDDAAAPDTTPRRKFGV